MFANPTLRLALGAAMISFSPIFVRLVSVEAEVSAFYRVFFGAIILISYLLYKREYQRFNKQFLLIIVMAAFFFALDLGFWHKSIQYVGAGLSTLLANFQVIILTIVGFFFFKDRPTLIKLAAIPLALFGLFLILGSGDLNSKGYLAGIMFGLLTAISYAGYILCLRQARSGQDAHITTLQEVTMVTVLTVFILGIYLMVNNISFVLPAKDIGWMFLYGLISQTIGWLLITSSLPYLPTSRVALILLLQPTLAYVWEVLIFDRLVTPLEAIGAFIAMLAIYIGSQETEKSP